MFRKPLEACGSWRPVGAAALRVKKIQAVLQLARFAVQFSYLSLE
jgi:hypothetical protein